ncbi:MAG: HU family DNA-binding protein [Opitutales bacterium]|nr:HU family DNA-binding protein [Opitutales bacterium]
MDKNLTKKEIIESVYRQTELSRVDISALLDIFLDTLFKALVAGRNIEFRNFGVFEQQIRKSRVGRNPNCPSHTVVIPEHRVVKFRAGKQLLVAIRDKDSKH